ncbi:7040_t:CDS:2, partial [Racocetra fulgida]
MAEPKKNKTKQTNLYISRLKGVTSLVNPDYTPNIKIDNNQGWQQVLIALKQHKEQTQIKLDWEEFYYRVNHVQAMYNQVKQTDEHLQKEEINKLIKSSIPGYDPQNSSFNEFSCWKNLYDQILAVKENIIFEQNQNVVLEQEINVLEEEINVLEQKIHILEDERKSALDIIKSDNNDLEKSHANMHAKVTNLLEEIITENTKLNVQLWGSTSSEIG